MLIYPGIDFRGSYFTFIYMATSKLPENTLLSFKELQ